MKHFLLLGFLVPQERPCDLAIVESTPFCVPCHRLDPPILANGACADCGTVPVLVEACVKSRPGSTIKACIVLRCERCGRTGNRESPCPVPTCIVAGAWIRRTCEKSGTWPHGGEPPKLTGPQISCAPPPTTRTASA